MVATSLMTIEDFELLGDEAEDYEVLDGILVARDRLTPEVDEQGYVLVIPDLVVEVASPNDRPGRMMRKIERYRQAGVRLIWLVQPRLRAITVFAVGQEPRTLGDRDELGGGDVLPGFRLRLMDVFR